MNSQILRVGDALASIFQRVQEDRSTRCLDVKIEGEELLCAQTFPVAGDVQAEWVAIQAGTTAPSLLLVHIESSNGPWKWVLIAHVPDSLPAREKMLYASARDCLKQQLGLSYFVGDVHTTDLATFGYRDVLATTHNNIGPLSEKEVLLKEEARLERDLSVKASAMSVMPFGIAPACAAALDAFASGGSFLSMQLENETLTVLKQLPATHEVHLSLELARHVPSYVLYRHSDRRLVVFLYVCPDDAPVRLKMTYSTAKASVLALLPAHNITVDKTIEITDVATALEAIQSDIAHEEAEAPVLVQPKAFSRPAAPGRARRK
ncbi:twinfilin-like protein [Achlya hypogyna]|uniref:Twinfilin-like protein n=1 Tax=Achlya hypogyna TaxID=1202772 RepID=A0A1V9ZP07_ACHHY|nr:twinfilin-like protein [Achlya hypogyna]